MFSLYTVQPANTLPAVSTAPSTPPPPAPAATTGSTRTYYIAAEDVEWLYVDPTSWSLGLDKCSGLALTSRQLASMQGDGVAKIGYNYTKTRYIEYTDATFSTRKTVPVEQEHMGILGPPIHAVVGDTIVVHYRNNARFNTSIHPHGVHYSKANEGSPYADNTTGLMKLDDMVPPGGEHTYNWEVPGSAGPGLRDPSSIVWLYHSHANEVNDTNTGLIGAIVVTQANKANLTTGRPTDVDQEFFVLPMVFDENKSRYVQENMQKRLPNFRGNLQSCSGNPTCPERDRLYYQLQTEGYFQKYNKKHTINGKAFCSLPTMAIAPSSSRVRWYSLSLGDEQPHTPTWQGHTLDFAGHRVDTLELMSASMLTADMSPPLVGNWTLFCNTQDYLTKGMKTAFSVAPPAGYKPPTIGGVSETYYIAADEVEWDYLPLGKGMCADPNANPAAGLDAAYIDPTVPFKLVRQTRS